MRRLLIAVLLAMPGIALAFLAKPLVLGDAVLFIGLLLAFSIPVAWLVAPSA
jgi:hypothetical protein